MGGAGAALVLGGIVVMAGGSPGGIALLAIGLLLLMLSQPAPPRSPPLPPRPSALPADGRRAWCRPCGYRHTCFEPHWWQEPENAYKIAQERLRKPPDPLPDLREIYGPLMLQSPDLPVRVHRSRVDGS